MMNRNEKLEIAKRLRLSTESELSRDDLEQMLDAELSKPEAEMDTELVQQIVDLLEETPSQAQQREAWRKTDKRLKFKQWQPAVIGLTRIAAVGVVLITIMFATYGTAKALKWEFLLRLMRPFAETFTIYSGDEPVPTPEPVIGEVYGDMGMEFTQMEFSALADCPDKIDGYSVKPVWMPERFTYLQGSLYSDLQVTAVTHVFTSSEGRCVIDVSMVRDENDNNSYQFERVPDENEAECIDNYHVEFYDNSSNAYMTASWVDQNTQYSLTGSVSKEEIISIIDAMMK